MKEGAGENQETTAPEPTLAEEDLRLLQAARDGVAHERRVKFLGTWYTIKGTGLVALLRYAGQRHDPTGTVAMAHAHQIVEESVEDFAAFQEAAISGKARPDDITVVLRQIIEIFTARPWRAGLRLLGDAVQSLAELDGNLLRTTGRGVESLTPRQLCNIVYSLRLDGLDEEQRAEFIDDLYLDFDPDAEALKKVQAMIASKESG